MCRQFFRYLIRRQPGFACVSVCLTVGEFTFDHTQYVISKILFGCAPCVLRLTEGLARNDITSVEWCEGCSRSDVFELGNDGVRVLGVHPLGFAPLKEVLVADEDNGDF